jgi:hypothetical protein
VWADAIDADGERRDGAGLAEITGLLPTDALAGCPAGTRVIVRRERPHPGAQLDVMETRDGWRYTCFATDTRAGQLAFLDARHRAHARAEDRIRCGKDTGLDHFPSRTFAINQAWLLVVMLAVDLIAWTQELLLEGGLAQAEPKTLRYQLLHVAARITRGGRRTWIRIQQSWPWPTTSPPRSVACTPCPPRPAEHDPRPDKPLERPAEQQAGRSRTPGPGIAPQPQQEDQLSAVMNDRC